MTEVKNTSSLLSIYQGVSVELEQNLAFFPDVGCRQTFPSAFKLKAQTERPRQSSPILKREEMYSIKKGSLWK